MMYQKQSGRSAWINYSFALIAIFTMGLLFACQQNETDAISSKTSKVDPSNNSSIVQGNPAPDWGPDVKRVVDQSPLFPGCNDIKDTPSNKKECADQKLLEYLYSHLKYPDEARKAGIEGRTYVQFVIQKDGTIGQTHLVKDIGGGCGEAALAVINKMNDDGIRWTPGVDAGQQVDVLYTLPVIYKLEG